VIENCRIVRVRHAEIDGFIELIARVKSELRVPGKFLAATQFCG
jgi:hypothetical protein